MALRAGVRRGSAAGTAIALAVAVVPAAAGASGVGGATRVTGGSAAPRVADPSPTAPAPGPSVPSAADVEKARVAAQAAAREVAEITAQVQRAEARLRALQRAVAEAVAAHEGAEQRLADADAAVREATADLAAARHAREGADRALSASAALIYMQGGDLQNLTTLLLSPPGVMSDLAVVLDHNAGRARENLVAATTAAAEAAARERLLVSARDSHALALAEAGAAREGAERAAEQAGAEAARLGEQQVALTARLDALEENAASVAALREAAARLGSTALLGVQALGSPGSGPRVAQEIARPMVAAHGWDEAEFTCLVRLWHAESGWSWSATNPTSGAYGIPQALPGWKMASAGSDWLTNPATQITWGLGYIESVYGSPCRALDRFLARSPHWY